MSASPSLPPGPRLPALLQSILLVSSPLPFLLRSQRRYGDVFTVRAAGFGTFVVLGGPDEVRAVFTAPPDVLRAGESNAPLGPLLGERSVLLLDGPEHLRQRRLLLPPFHGERMRSWERVIERATRSEVESWPVGRPFALLPAMQEITLEVIVRAVFGVREAAGQEELAAAVGAVLEPLSGRVRVLLSVLSNGTIGDGGSTRRFAERLAAVDDLLFAEIAARRDRPDLAGRDDILSTLLLARDEAGTPMDDAEIRDELVTSSSPATRPRPPRWRGRSSGCSATPRARRARAVDRGRRDGVPRRGRRRDAPRAAHPLEPGARGR